MPLMLQNILLFQVGWFACVLGGASQHAWLGVAVVLPVIGVHLLLAQEMKPELQLILIAVVIGSIWDSVLTLAGLFQFSSGIIIEGLAPYWIIAMWALFATTLNVSLRWIRERLLLASLLGLVGGPLAYYAGHKLGAVDFADVTVSLAVIAVGWAVIMPVLMVIATRLNGYEPRAKEVTA